MRSGILLSLVALGGALPPSALADPAPKQERRIDGRTLSEWASVLHDEDAVQRQGAILALAKFGPEAAPILAQTLTDKDLVNVRLWAAHALGRQKVTSSAEKGTS